MAAQRRPDPKRFLDASLAPLEKALLARADEIEAGKDGLPAARRVLADVMAAEFRKLAAELHHW